VKIKISINGRVYSSLEEVPEELRELVDSDGDGVLDVVQKDFKGGAGKARAEAEAHGGVKKVARKELRAGIKELLTDRDGDGIPDVVEGSGQGPVRVTAEVSRSYTVNGRRYDSIEEMPAPARAAVQKLGPASRIKGFLRRLFGRK